MRAAPHAGGSASAKKAWTVLIATIGSARRGGAAKAASVDRVIVDTSLTPKAIAQSTDSQLLEKSAKPGQVGRGVGHRAAPELQPHRASASRAIGRYARAKNFKRMKQALHTRVGRVRRGVAPKPWSRGIHHRDGQGARHGHREQRLSIQGPAS